MKIKAYILLQTAIRCALLLCLCIPQGAMAGPDVTLDSLKRSLKTRSGDSSKAEVMSELARYFFQNGKADSALLYCNEAIRLATKAGHQQLLATAYTDRGRIHSDPGNYPEAMNDFQIALQMYAGSGDRKNEANLYNLIANTCHLQGDYPNALKNQYAALKIREEIRDEEGIAWSYNNIGTIYRIQGDYPAALKNYYSSLKLLEKFGDQKMIAIAHNNIGNVYSLQGKHPEALNSYFSSLKIREAIGDKKEIMASYINIGDAFCDLYEKDSLTREVQVELEGTETRRIGRDGWLDMAMRIQSRAQAMNQESGNTYYSIFSLSGMGRIHFLRQNYRESIALYSKAYGLAEEMEALELQKEIAKYLSDNYNRLKDFRNGMIWYEKYTAHKDSLFNQLKTDDLTRTRMKYEFEKKENEAKAVQDKKDALARVELERQKKMRNIFLGGFSLVLIFAGIFFYQRNNIRKEKTRSDNLLLNILPSEIASELKQTGTSRTKSFGEVSVMFADFVDFTKISEKISPEALVGEIHTCFSAFDLIIQKYKVEKIKTIGDAYLCAGGLPLSDPDHAEHVVRAALEIREYMRQRRKIKESKNEIPFELRIGIHSGPVVAGIVGVKKYAYDIWGDTVNIAARLEQSSLPGKINISSKTYELVKNKFQCSYRGKIEAKNKGEIDMYFLEA
ncbi:MAG: tetratricopeptide repeat protein [Bacteroidia bacterium]|nr:tetratricopeptide repeat protein [Bacteroidia bacterium]